MWLQILVKLNIVSELAVPSVRHKLSHKLLGNFLATFDISSNILATFDISSNFWFLGQLDSILHILSNLKEIKS